MTSNLIGAHARALVAGVDAHSIRDDLHRLACTDLAKALEGDPLVFRLVHGDIEDDRDSWRLQQLLDVAGTPLMIHATNDRTDWYLDPAYPTVLLAMEGVANTIAPCWWRWTLDGTDPAARPQDDVAGDGLATTEGGCSASTSPATSPDAGAAR